MIFIGREGLFRDVPSHLMVSVLFKEASEILLSVSSWQGSQDSFFCTGKWPHWVYCFFMFFRNHTKIVGCCEGWDSSDHLGVRWAIFQTTHLHTTWTQTFFYHGFSSRARAREVSLFGGDDGFQQAVGGAFSCRARGPIFVGWRCDGWRCVSPSPGGKNGENGGSNPISPPSGKHTKNYGKSQFLMGKIHYKSPFSIAFCIVY